MELEELEELKELEEQVEQVLLLELVVKPLMSLDPAWLPKIPVLLVNTSSPCP